MIRKAIFWTHLACGVACGLVILMMSVTGVILTYERQLLAWQIRDWHADPPAAGTRQPIETLLAAAAGDDPSFVPTSVRVSSDPRAPVLVSAGRSESRYLNPYTGDLLGEPPTGLDGFFGAVTGWHRWFNANGDSRAAWRAVTGISNLAFLFLIASGIYLWLPRSYRWVMFRAHLLFSRHALHGKARDYNWHHVLGIWTAIPLFVVVATAVVFSYPWASDGVYRAFGEQPPAGRGGPPAAAPAAGSALAGPGLAEPAAESGLAGSATGPAFAGPAAGPSSAGVPLPLDALLRRATVQAGDWQTITVNLPAADAGTVSVAIDQGNGGQPQLRHNLTLDAFSGQVADWQPFDSQTPGRRARLWIRFLHTGEALGIGGQTVAGIVSLTSIIMVWTGLALAWRRLIAPLFRRRG